MQGLERGNLIICLFSFIQLLKLSFSLSLNTYIKQEKNKSYYTISTYFYDLMLSQIFSPNYFCNPNFSTTASQSGEIRRYR